MPVTLNGRWHAPAPHRSVVSRLPHARMLVLALGLFIAVGTTAGLFLHSAFVAQASDAAMGIQVYKDKAGTMLSCDTGALHRTCDVAVGQSFDVRILATNPPTAGYTAYQTVLQYDSLVNLVGQAGTAEGKVPCNPAVESMPASNRYEFECKFAGGSSNYSGPLVNVFFVCKTTGQAQIDLIGGAGAGVSLYISPSIHGSTVFLKSFTKGAKSVADAVLINCKEPSTPTATATATATDTSTSTATSTPTDTATPTDTGTPTSTATPTRTGTPEDTATPTDTGTPTSTATPTRTGTPEDTATPTRTGTPEDTATPTDTGTPEDTPTSTRTGTPVNTSTPTRTGTPVDTATPTNTSPADTPTSTNTPPSSTATPTHTAPPGSTSTPTPTTTDTSPITVTPEVCKDVVSESGDEEGELAAGPEATCTPTPEPTDTPPVTPESTVLGSTVQPPGGPGAPILPDSGGGSPTSPGGFLAIAGLLAAAGILLVQWARLRLAGIVTVVPSRFGTLPDVITPPAFVPRR